jgi:hypothetical protein
MPARTNEFQALVVSLKQQLQASQGFRITESKMLRHQVTGRLREVDIVIEYEVAEHPIIISIECRDRSRPANVDWVEQMCCKHEHLPTNKLILVSVGGFTPQAIELANHYHAEVASFNEARTLPWTDITAKAGNLVLQYVQSHFEVRAKVTDDSGVDQLFPIGLGVELYTKDPKSNINVGKLVELLNNRPEFVESILNHVVPGTKKIMSVEYIHNIPFFALDSVGNERRIQALVIAFHATGYLSPLKLRTGNIWDASVAYGSADVGDDKLDISIIERKDKSPTAVVRRRPPTISTRRSE